MFLKKNSTKIFVLSQFVLYATMIFYGMDVTDTGFHLSKQWCMFHGLWNENLDAIAGTNFFGGLWLSIPGHASMIWARVGFVLVQTGVGYFSYKILCLYFKESSVFPVAFILSISLSVWQTYFTINYDNLSLLFLITSVYLILLTEKEGRIPSVYLLVLSGLFTVTAVFCKISMVLSLILVPLLIFFISKKVNIKIKYLKYYFSGAVIATLSVIMLLFFSKGMTVYLENIFGIAQDLQVSGFENSPGSHDHSFSTLLNLYQSSFFISFVYSINFVLILIVSAYFLTRSKSIKPVFYLLWIIVLFFVYNTVIIKHNFYTTNLDLYQQSVKIMSLSIAVIAIWLLRSRPSNIVKYSSGIYAVTAIFILSFTGSDLGIMTAFRTGAGVPLIGMSALILTENAAAVKKTGIDLKYLLYIILMMFLIFYFKTDYHSHRDLNIDELDSKFKSTQLSFIKSTKKRVDVTDSLIAFMSKIPDLGRQKVFFAKHSPMYYYLTMTKYPLKTPWDTLNRLEDIKTDFTDDPPDIFILPKGSHRDSRWPVYEQRALEESAEKKAENYYDFYDSFIKENNYVEVYKNSFYTVYSLEDEGVQNGQSTE